MVPPAAETALEYCYSSRILLIPRLSSPQPCNQEGEGVQTASSCCNSSALLLLELRWLCWSCCSSVELQTAALLLLGLLGHLLVICWSSADLKAWARGREKSPTSCRSESSNYKLGRWSIKSKDIIGYKYNKLNTSGQNIGKMDQQKVTNSTIAVLQNV